jgi:hypothetical protein
VLPKIVKVLLLKSMRMKRWGIPIAAIGVIAVVFAVAYHRHNLQIERSRHVRRPLQQDASSIGDSQMLQGKFSSAVSAQNRQVVESALKAADQPEPAQSQIPETGARTGKQQIVLTQPLGTTVEDTEPTFTWDAPAGIWTYRVHIEEGESHQTIATSSPLDEAIWRVSTPLLRGHKYVWRVDAVIEGSRSPVPSLSSATGEFAILSDEGEREIQNARAGNPSHLILGSLYTHYQMWPDAVLEYRKLVNDVPNSPDALKLLRNAELRSNAQLAAATQK